MNQLTDPRFDANKTLGVFGHEFVLCHNTSDRPRHARSFNSFCAVVFRKVCLKNRLTSQEIAV